MSVTREQVDDLREGDVVELRWDRFPGHVVTSTVRQERDGKYIGPGLLAWGNGEVASYLKDDATLTVVSRAPRLYVNHDRTQPVPGDVVRDASSAVGNRTWMYGSRKISGDLLSHPWGDSQDPGIFCRRQQLPDRLRLLIDGETGHVVPS